MMIIALALCMLGSFATSCAGFRAFEERQAQRRAYEHKLATLKMPTTREKLHTALSPIGPGIPNAVMAFPSTMPMTERFVLSSDYSIVAAICYKDPMLKPRYRAGLRETQVSRKPTPNEIDALLSMRCDPSPDDTVVKASLVPTKNE